MKSIKTCISLAASLLVTSAAFAHGNEDHAAKPGQTAAAEDHHHDSAAFGEAGDAAHVDRTINVDMSDSMRFAPASIPVRRGETVRFVVRNGGLLKHEMVLGTEHALKEHSELMKKFPEMEHSDPQMVTVAPGKTGEIVWRFTRTGKVDFACLQSGHYDAGMKGLVIVAAGKGATVRGGSAAEHRH